MLVGFPGALEGKEEGLQDAQAEHGDEGEFAGQVEGEVPEDHSGQDREVEIRERIQGCERMSKRSSYKTVLWKVSSSTIGETLPL